MNKTIILLLLLFSFSVPYAESFPEFDGSYIQTQKGKFIELKEKISKKTEIMTKYRWKEYIAPNTTKSYLGYYPIRYIKNNNNILKVHPIDFKGIYIKGSHEFKNLSLHKLVNLPPNDILSYKDVAVDKKEPPLKKGQSFYVPGPKIDVRKKTIDDYTRYFQPRKDIRIGEYVLRLGKSFWLFEVTDSSDFEKSNPIFKPHTLTLKNIYKTIEDMPDSSYLGFHVKGETLEGELVDRIIYFPTGNKKLKGKERLKNIVGMGLRTEKDKILVDDLSFGGPAEYRGIDFDWEIINLHRLIVE